MMYFKEKTIKKIDTIAVGLTIATLLAAAYITFF